MQVASKFNIWKVKGPSGVAVAKIEAAGASHPAQGVAGLAYSYLFLTAPTVSR